MAPPDDDLTRTRFDSVARTSLGADQTVLATGVATSSGTGLSTSAAHGFPPGAIIAGRYRVVALLGRGGMGEVYRADDLTLDQPVALKFLPVSAAMDEARLAQLHNELRTARQISHKNVCRLYDLGEADGRRFLTMEYVDGEDLASLLRRIGRIPQDKAVQIARQLCAGIAAAHDRGIVHRDLKPANVMLDGEGHVRITDFGIAAVVGEDVQDLSGTPHYMAPEQLAGRSASVQSDIYALGLILFEIFTGRRAVEGQTLDDLREFHRTGTLTTPSSLVGDLDPAVERVIMRCLEREPERRPVSALVVAAGLPGGDPLAAALAAGDTPSPELLAAAGETEALRVVPAVAMMSLTLAGLLAYAAFSPGVSVAGRVPLDLPPAVLADRAEQLMASFGHTAPSADRAHGFMRHRDYTSWLFRTRSGPTRYAPIADGNPSAVLFWYRSSPQTLQPLATGLPLLGPLMPGAVAPFDPPLTNSNMRLVVLDGRGRLHELRAVPPDVDEAVDAADAPPWERVFEAAGLPASAFAPATPRRNPEVFADARAAWEGPLSGGSEFQIQVEASAYGGRPVWFQVMGPWTRSTELLQSWWVDRMLVASIVIVILAAIAAAAVLARRNLRANRADRRGAARLVAAVAALGFTAWLVGAHHPFTVFGEFASLVRVASQIALIAVLVWSMYLAFEPYVRRLWPDALLGWSRLLAGHIRDPRVGRDLLIGLLAGVAVSLLAVARGIVIPWLGYSEPSLNLGTAIEVLSGSGALIVRWVQATMTSLQSAFIMVVLAVLLRLTTRWSWLSTVVIVTLLSTPAMEQAVTTNTSLPFVLAFGTGAILTLVMFRAGLLAFAVAWFVWTVLTAVPMMPDVFHWSAAAGNWTIAVLAALTLFAFYAARSGQPLFGTILSPYAARNANFVLVASEPHKGLGAPRARPRGAERGNGAPASDEPGSGAEPRSS